MSPSSLAFLRLVRKLRQLSVLKETDLAAIELIVDDAIQHRTRAADRQHRRSLVFRAPQRMSTRLSYLMVPALSLLHYY